ncbi:MAG: hypothetical protein RMA76_23845 [Deltaproteobacteria bacterium]|jgi:hypothetical protein
MSTAQATAQDRHDVDLIQALTRFVERSVSEHMPDAASTLLELLEEDEVEGLSTPGDEVYAEDVADQLENKLTRIRKRSDDPPEGLLLIEDAIAGLRTIDGQMVSPWLFEDGDGVRWFVLVDGSNGEVAACYTTAPFIEADI